MEFISWIANGFMSLFQAGGEQFMGWVTGIIPLVVCLMTAINSIIKLIGEDRVENFAKKMKQKQSLLQKLTLMSPLKRSMPVRMYFWQFFSLEIQCPIRLVVL